MASSWDKLGQAASVMQVTGVDALGLVSMIVQAAHTARHNRDRCQLLAQHVETVGGLLRKLDIPELRRHPETRRPLEQLDAALFGAYKLVRSCSQYQENRSQLYQMFTGADVASKLRLAQEEIDRYINLIPMITLVAVLDARGTQEDVTVDRALAQRPRLSLQEVNESLALEERPTTGLPVNMESRRNGWHLMIDNVRSLAGWRLITYQVAPETHLPRGIRSFSYNELCHATNKFSDKEKLGEGGNGGFIYRGFLKDEALHVAVERVDASRCGYDVELRTQLKIFSEIRHHSLVKLVGWSNKADQLFLVYELATNGFLDTHLQDSRNMLKWPIRYRIILGIGSALLYLNREIADIAIVHRDISPRNMMLDSSLDVKLLYCPWRGLIGTMGYIDLIRIIADSAGAESDVYSFGVVLLEIACGRRPIFSLEDQTKVHLVNWVWELYGKDALLDAADPRLNSDFEVHEMKLRLRPSINEAMNVLGHFEAPLPNLPLVMPEFRQR